ncbi:MAG: DUF664 domain-containing protein [Nocardioidaceae bacterium]
MPDAVDVNACFHPRNDLTVTPEETRIDCVTRDQTGHAHAGCQRTDLAALLDGLTEEEARARLVPSLTTVLGLVSHATFVEQVWFHHRVAGVSREQVEIPETVDESVTLAPEDTVVEVRRRYLDACDRSREIAASAPGD